MKKGILALSDGSLFYGRSVGMDGYAVGELIFNTSMTGYQEILTDPSYLNQIITFTSPHLGNVGVNQEDMESDRVWATGVIMRDMVSNPRHWKSVKSLSDFLQEQHVVALTDIDTRRLTHIIREKGNLFACISTEHLDVDAALQRARSLTLNHHVMNRITTQRIRHILDKDNRFHVVVIDCGVKISILNQLQKLGCDMSIVPMDVTLDEIKALRPDGILLSNGPGDPAKCENLVKLTRDILSAQIPLFAICLGHQIFALAFGAKIYKMPFGQHGANHPIYDINQKKVLISNQNHNYAVTHNHLPKHLSITHRSLFDGSIAGLICTYAPALSFQGHPEAGPGPQDCSNLFTQFKYLLEKHHAKKD